MLDLNDVRSRPAAYQEACDNKRVNLDIAQFLEIDSRVRVQRTEVETLRARQNSFSKEIAQLSGDEKQKGLAEMKELSERVKVSSQNLRDMEEDWKAQQLRIPSIPLPKVPVGKDDSENVEVKKWGTPAKFDFKLRDHVELGKHLDIIDVERGVKISGARNYFLKGDGTRLQHAVMQLAISQLHSKGYVVMDPPHIVKYEAMMGTGYFPGGEEQAYHLDDRDKDMFLIGTSEVPVASYHMDEILTKEQLPKRYAGYSPCYRREAGTYGKDTAGIYRIHQFYKVEQVVICEADDEVSAKFHTELLTNAEELMQLLELPYRVVDVCTGDMGLGQVYKNDIETWMPSRNNYGETHSCSTFHDFQARRLNLRYKSENKNVFCHTLNNTLVASPRILIPLLEVHQTKEGNVNIPKALQPFMGGQTLIKPRQ